MALPGVPSHTVGARNLRHRLQPLLRLFTSPEILSLSNLISTSVCLISSFYAYKAGHFLGAISRTPELASVFFDRKVLQGSFSPHEVRWYAWSLLWLSVATATWSALAVYQSLNLELENGGTGSVSPKLPLAAVTTANHVKYTPLSSAFTSTLTAYPNPFDPAVIRAKRTASISRIRKCIILFVFAFAFIKKQHVGSTLLYHPVNSPVLLQALDDNDLSIDLSTEREAGLQMAKGELAELQSEGIQPTDSLYMSNARQKENVVPPILHFVFGMDRTFGGKPFGYAHYLSIYSAMVENKPEKVMFWYHFLPSAPESPNWWFDRIQADAKELGVIFELKLARNVNSIFGNRVSKFAHKADVLRLEALLSYGGIYLDLDVYTIRPFSPLMHFSTVLGLEGGVPALPRQGLCNGIIVAEKNSSFVKRWYESYKSFEDKDWAGHSVKLPLKLAMDNPEEILVLDPFAMFYPGWNNDGLRMVHSRSAEINGEGWDFDSSQQFAYHAWSSFTGKQWLARITPDKVFEIETSFNLLVRRWTGEGLRRDWRAAKAKGLVDQERTK